MYHCFCSTGGKCLSVEYTDKVGEIVKSHGLKLHINGAHIFNASVVSSMVHACAVLRFYLYLLLILSYFGLVKSALWDLDPTAAVAYRFVDITV
jgi:hypothetical protein